MIDLKKNTLLREIPDNLLEDPKVINLAKALQVPLDEMIDWAFKLNYTTNLNELDDDILDHLLWEKHIGWNEGLSLATTKEAKINLINAANELHRTKGTPYAIERILETLNINGKVIEWFDYDGNPYHFKILLDITDRGIDEQLFTLTEQLIENYKRKSAYLEQLQMRLRGNSRLTIGSTLTTGEIGVLYPNTVTKLDQKSNFNFNFGQFGGEVVTVYPHRNKDLEQTMSNILVLTISAGETTTIYPA